MIALIVVLAVAFLVVFCWLSNNFLSSSHHTIRRVRASHDLTIVHLSDLHGKSFGKGNARLIKKIIKYSPDVICFTGDSVHKYRERDLKVALAFFGELTQVAPVLFVAGNHEMRNKQWRELKQNLLKSGVTVLENESVTIDGVHFFGLNGASLKNQTLENLVLKEGCNVLLAHDPRYFKRYCAKGFDLVLCGHAHGGQFRIPFTKRGVYAPGLGLLPTYCMGSYSDGRTTMIVSRGLGNSEFPLRLFNPPEVVTVRITAQK